MAITALLLKWEGFEEDIKATYCALRKQHDFADVTLACDDGVQVEAHKVVLTVCSSVFHNVLQGNKHPHPLIFLRGISYNTLSSILDFIYFGEVEIEDEKLKDFLVAAEDLKLKGISSNIKMDDRLTYTDQTRSSENKHDISLFKEGIKVSSNKRENPTLEILLQDDLTLEHTASTEFINEPQYTSKYFVIKGIETNICPPSLISTEPILDTANLEKSESEKLLFDNEDIQYECTVCGNVLNSKALLGAHAQRHLPGFSTTTDDNICPKCEKAFKSKSIMYKHISKHHNDKKIETKKRFEGLDVEVKPFISRLGPNNWMCKVCGKKGSKTHTSSHVELRHMDISIPCTKCGHISKNREALRAHFTRYCKIQNIE